MNKLSVRDLNLSGKKALIRVDFNVPIDHGQITDDTRIQASLPTIKYVLEKGGSVILMSHLGRPQEDQPTPELSLVPIAKHLSKLLQKPVKMAPNCVGPAVEKLAKELQPGEILMLENLRFHKGEEKPKEEPSFADALASLGDVYINDAFGSAHRAHASTAVVAKFFPENAAAGFLMEKEIDYLGNHLSNPERPFCAILGGSKISTKFKVIEALIRKADVLLIGGAMANTFFKAEQINIGNSFYEPQFVSVAREMLDVSIQPKARILLPIDVVIAPDLKSMENIKIIDLAQGIPAGFMAVDIGPKTVKLFAEEMKKSATIFWNGPLGVYENPDFAKGTMAIAKQLAQVNAITIVGGGDSIAAINESGVSDQISHISTGGGASLEYIELGTLPGIEALSNKITKGGK